MAVAAPPGTNSAGGTNQKMQPNQSLYLQNLPEKMKKDDLKQELYMLFSTYGPVLDITAMRGKNMRGSAHVLFRDVQTATQVMRSCWGIEFGGREMRISYAKTRSNTLAKMTGTFGQPAPAPTTTTQAPPPSTISQPPTGFPAPPGSLPGPPNSLPPPPGTLPPPPTGLPPPPKVNGEVNAALKPPQKVEEEVASPQGAKRAREESDEESDAAMEQDEEEEEEGGEMEMSDEE